MNSFPVLFVITALSDWVAYTVSGSWPIAAGVAAVAFVIVGWLGPVGVATILLAGVWAAIKVIAKDVNPLR